jgi:hypothetical protein
MWHHDQRVDKTTIYLTDIQRRRLREVARRTGRRQADVIRSALDAYLDRDEPVRPRSIGAGSDEGLDATGTEAWLRERWQHR